MQQQQNAFENHPALAAWMEKLANIGVPGWNMHDWQSFTDAVNAAVASSPVVAPVDGHGYTGPFTAMEFYERAFDHEKAARNGMAAGPNVSYVRTFQACAHALRLAAPLLPRLEPAI